MLRGLPSRRLTDGGPDTSADHRLTPRLLVLPGVALHVARPPRELRAPRVYCFLHRSCMMHVCMVISADGKRCTNGMAYDAHACMCM
jgi:hypothetical protein